MTPTPHTHASTIVFLIEVVSHVSYICVNGAMVGSPAPPTPLFFFKILLYIWVLILAILFYKITLSSP